MGGREPICTAAGCPVRHRHGRDSTIARALGSDFKGKISLVAYALAISVAFYLPWLACAIYAGVAGMWLIPDRRIERVLTE
jgi:TMEM175 potassium channel family protein